MSLILLSALNWLILTAALGKLEGCVELLSGWSTRRKEGGIAETGINTRGLGRQEECWNNVLQFRISWRSLSKTLAHGGEYLPDTGANCIDFRTNILISSEKTNCSGVCKSRIPTTYMQPQH